MRIVRRYTLTGTGADYVLVELDNSNRVEFKIQAGMPDDDATILVLAVFYVESQRPPEPSIEVECEDGFIAG